MIVPVVSEETRARGQAALAALQMKAESLDNRRCRRIVTTLRNCLMIVDVVLDIAVTGSLYGTRNFYVAIWLLCLPFVVLSLLLYRPAFRTQSRALGSMAFSAPAFAVVWAFVALPTVIFTDVILFTWYLTVDTSATARIMYYARLRHVTEAVFESFPQALFQLALAREDRSLLLVGSVLISCINIVVHTVEMTIEAGERGVSLRAHLADVMAAGFGALPFIGAIRARRIEDASFADLPLISRDLDAILSAVEDGARKAAAVAAAQAALLAGKVDAGSLDGGAGASQALSAKKSDWSPGSGIASLDLSNVGLGADVCKAGFAQLCDCLRERRLGNLRHLAVDRNGFGRAEGRALGEAIAFAVHRANAASSRETTAARGRHTAAAAATAATSSSSFRDLDEFDRVASEAAGVLAGALPALPASVVVDRRLLDVATITAAAEVDFRVLDLLDRVSGPDAPAAPADGILGAPCAGEAPAEVPEKKARRLSASAKLQSFAAHDVEACSSSSSSNGGGGGYMSVFGGGYFGGGGGGSGAEPELPAFAVRLLESRGHLVRGDHQGAGAGKIGTVAHVTAKVTAKAARIYALGAREEKPESKRNRKNARLSTALEREPFYGASSPWHAAEQALVLALLPVNAGRLRRLALWGGDFSAETGDARALCAVLRGLPSLDFLDCRGCCVDRGTKRLLVAALAGPAKRPAEDANAAAAAVWSSAGSNAGKAAKGAKAAARKQQQQQQQQKQQRAAAASDSDESDESDESGDKDGGAPAAVDEAFTPACGLRCVG